VKEVKRTGIGDVLDIWIGSPLEVGEWVAAGQPEMWILCHEAYGFRLFCDAAYGNLAITANNYVVIDVGKDFVSCSNMFIVGLSEYYGIDKPTLYRRAGDSREVISVLAGAPDGGH
jgi:hypothetical protein